MYTYVLHTLPVLARPIGHQWIRTFRKWVPLRNWLNIFVDSHDNSTSRMNNDFRGFAWVQDLKN